MPDQTTPIEFPVSLQIRLDWSELDLFAHINNVMFFKYIQASRINYWEKISLLDSFHTEKIGPLLANNTCQFKKPLYYPGNIEVKARVEFIRNTSFGIHHIIVDDKGDIAAEAHDIIVLYDFNKETKIQVSTELRKRIEVLEKRTFEQ